MKTYLAKITLASVMLIFLGCSEEYYNNRTDEDPGELFARAKTPIDVDAEITQIDASQFKGASFLTFQLRDITGNISERIEANICVSGCRKGTEAIPEATTFRVGDKIRLYGFSYIKGDLIVVDSVSSALPLQRDEIPPTPPTDFLGVALNYDTIELTWTPSTDNEGGGGVETYQIFRNETLIGESKEPVFTDSGLISKTKYTYLVRATDFAGNQSYLSDALEVETLTAVAIQDPAENAVGQSGIEVAGVCEPDSVIKAKGDGIVETDGQICEGGLFSLAVEFSGEDGAKEVIIEQAINLIYLSEDKRIFVKDSTPPTVRIMTPQANSFVQASEKVQGSCEGDLPVKLSGDIKATVEAPCVDGLFEGVVAITDESGSKKLVADQLDGAGNLGTDEVNVMFDLSVPQITIAEPLNNSKVTTRMVRVAGSCEAGLPVSLGGSGVEMAISQPCANDGSYAADIVIKDGDGSKQITTSQTDNAGNSGMATVVVNYKEVNGPVLYADNCANCHGSLANSNKKNRSFQQIKDAIINVPIMARAEYGLKDLFDNEIQGIAEALTVALTIDSPAAMTVAKDGITLAGKCTANASLTISGSVAQQLNRTCGSGGTYSIPVSFSAGDGSKTITISQTDGNNLTTSLSRQFLRDATPPAIDFIQPMAGALTNSLDVAVTGTCEAGYSVRISGSGVSTTQSVSCIQGSFSRNVSLNSGDGSKQITISQQDQVGNSSSKSRTITLDTKAPAISILDPAANTAAKDKIVISGACENNLTIEISGSGAVQRNTLCSNGQYSVEVTFAGGAGSKIVQAIQMDAAGNRGVAQRAFVNDSQAPNLTVDEPNEGDQFQNTFDLAGSCENNLPILVSGDAGSSTQTCSNSAYIVSLELGGGDGNKVLMVQQEDSAGNKTVITRNIVKDSTAPIVEILSPDAGTKDENGVLISGTCEAGITVRIEGLGVETPTNTSCSAQGTFSSSVLFSVNDGNKSIIVSQTDQAGNKGMDTRTFEKGTSGELLYAAYCAGCHNPLENTKKPGRSAAQIADAIAGVKSMNFLGEGDGIDPDLSSEQIQMIADALGGSNNTPSEGPVSSFQLPIATRKGMASTLSAAFLDANSPDGNVESKINNLVNDQVAAFGGSCRRYDENCPGGENLHEANVNASQSPSANVQRRGYMIRVCDEVLAINSAVVSALDKVQLSVNDQGTQANIEKVAFALLQGKPLDGNTMQSLMNVHARAIDLNMSNTDAWRFTLQPICQSALFDIL